MGGGSRAVSRGAGPSGASARGGGCRFGPEPEACQPAAARTRCHCRRNASGSRKARSKPAAGTGGTTHAHIQVLDELLILRERHLLGLHSLRFGPAGHCESKILRRGGARRAVSSARANSEAAVGPGGAHPGPDAVPRRQGRVTRVGQGRFRHRRRVSAPFARARPVRRPGGSLCRSCFTPCRCESKSRAHEQSR